VLEEEKGGGEKAEEIALMGGGEEKKVSIMGRKYILAAGPEKKKPKERGKPGKEADQVLAGKRGGDEDSLMQYGHASQDWAVSAKKKGKGKDQAHGGKQCTLGAEGG